MAGEYRTTVDPVESLQQALAELPERIRSCDFIAAVRQLECARPDKPRVGDAVRVRDDLVRLSQHVGLGFQGTALQSLSAAKGAQEHRLHVNFLGLLGSNGPLPLHFTEYADQRSRHHADPTFREFLDLFNHRILTYFYKASVQFDPAVSFDRPDANVYAEFLGALCGLMPEAAHDRDCIADAVKHYYPGWLSDSAKSPDGIVALLGDYFDLPVRVREWVGGWLPLPLEHQCRMDSRRRTLVLGHASTLGRRVWSIRHKFVVQLGPLDWDTFLSFKPGGARGRALHDLVRNYVGDEWDWDLKLILKPGEGRGLSLNRRSALGFDSWLRSRGGRNISSESVLLHGRLLAQPVPLH